MPSTSKAQQRLMGMAYALKIGEMDPKDASQEVKDLAAGMTKKQLHDFAATKHKGLPDHVGEDATGLSTPSNTPGMGDVSVPGNPGTSTSFSGQKVGSGDIPMPGKKKKKMKLVESFEEFSKNSESLEESININDPVLMSIRASREDRAKRVEAQAERMKKRVYGKQREKLEDELWRISIDLKDAYAERRNIYNDMESEAGQKGDEWSDDDANRYGSRLNLVDDEIESLLKRRQAIEIKLAY